MKKLALTLAVLFATASTAFGLETDDYGFPVWSSSATYRVQQSNQGTTTFRTQQRPTYTQQPVYTQQTAYTQPAYYAQPTQSGYYVPNRTYAQQPVYRQRSTTRVTPFRTRTISISNFFRN